MEESRKSYTKGYLAIKPREGKMTVANLVNFGEASGAYGRADTGVVRWGKSAGFILAYIVVCIVLTRIIGMWFISIFVWILLLPVPFRLISLMVWDEKRVKRDYLATLNLKTSPVDYTVYVGFYDITLSFPHIILYTDGTLGVALELVRKTESGSLESRAFEHSRHLAYFYNLCGSKGLTPELIDVQSLNAHDSRFDTLYNYLKTVRNTVLESIMASMYHHWEDRSSQSRLTHEYFIVRGTGDMDTFAENIKELRRALKDASYRAIRVLDQNGVADLIGSTFGINNFPIREAMDQVALKAGSSTLRLLWLGDKDNKRKHVNRPNIVSEPSPYANTEPKSPVKSEVNVKSGNEEGEAPMVDLFGGVASDKSEYKSMTTILSDDSDFVTASTNIEKSVDLESGVSKDDSSVDLF